MSKFYHKTSRNDEQIQQDGRTQNQLAKINTFSIQFTIPSMEINYLEINLTMELKFLSNENFTFLKKEIEKDTRK